MIRDHTFESVILPLTYAEAQSLIISHDALDLPLNFDRDTALRRLLPVDQGGDNGTATIVALQHRITAAIASSPSFTTHGCMIKTCMRSPKDVPLKSPSTIHLDQFRTALGAPTGKRPGDYNWMNDLTAFSQALTNALCVHDGKVCITYITRML